MRVSAIMPTRGRREYAAGALQCLLGQTCQDKELVIVDDADDPSFPTMSGDAEFGLHDGAYPDNIQIKYYRLSNRLTIGAKRNLACSRASGEVICHWDSDDVSNPLRIEDQLTRLIDSGKPLTGYNAMRFFDAEDGQWWHYQGHRKYVIGASMMYTRDFWKSNRFADINIGEDGEFTSRGKRTTVPAGEMMWARMHADSTCKRPKKLEGDGWTKVA